MYCSKFLIFCIEITKLSIKDLVLLIFVKHYSRMNIIEDTLITSILRNLFTLLNKSDNDITSLQLPNQKECKITVVY